MFELLWFFEERFAGNGEELRLIGRSIVVEQCFSTMLSGNA